VASIEYGLTLIPPAGLGLRAVHFDVRDPAASFRRALDLLQG